MAVADPTYSMDLERRTSIAEDDASVAVVALCPAATEAYVSHKPTGPDDQVSPFVTITVRAVARMRNLPFKLAAFIPQVIKDFVSGTTPEAQRAEAEMINDVQRQISVRLQPPDRVAEELVPPPDFRGTVVTKGPLDTMVRTHFRPVAVHQNHVEQLKTKVGDLQLNIGSAADWVAECVPHMREDPGWASP